MARKRKKKEYVVTLYIGGKRYASRRTEAFTKLDAEKKIKKEFLQRKLFVRARTWPEVRRYGRG